MINNTILFHTVLKNNMSNDKTFQINKNNESQKLYLVYGDTEYETAYGISINIFGVFDTKEKAIQQKRKKEKEYKKLATNYYNDSNYQSFNISFSILEIDLNEDIDKYLGGYIE